MKPYILIEPRLDPEDENLALFTVSAGGGEGSITEDGMWKILGALVDDHRAKQEKKDTEDWEQFVSHG
jgi:hypothetical protein